MTAVEIDVVVAHSKEWSSEKKIQIDIPPRK